jgi:hypothetical protein
MEKTLLDCLIESMGVMIPLITADPRMRLTDVETFENSTRWTISLDGEDEQMFMEIGVKKP